MAKLLAFKAPRKMSNSMCFLNNFSHYPMRHFTWSVIASRTTLFHHG